jgi:hypothetical protein
VCNANIPRSVRVISTQQAAEAVRRTRPDRVVPVHWGTWWPARLPQRADLIDLPAAAFAAQVVRIAPATSVHVLRSSSSVGRAPAVGIRAWTATTQQVPASRGKGVRPHEGHPLAICPGHLSMLAAR